MLDAPKKMAQVFVSLKRINEDALALLLDRHFVMNCGGHS